MKKQKVGTVMTKLKNEKVPGEDAIPNEFSNALNEV